MDVVVLEVGPDDAFEVAAAKDEDPVEVFAPRRADPAFGVGVRSGCSDRGTDDGDLGPAQWAAVVTGVPTNGQEQLGLRFYVDTNFLTDRSPAAERLRELDREGRIGLLRTDTVDTELLESADAAERAQLRAESGRYIESLGATVLDHSRLDSSLVASEQDADRLDKVFRILAPNTDRRLSTRGRAKAKVRDAMQIATAIRYGGTGLITRDYRDILRRRQEIADAFDGFLVLTPEQALEIVERFMRRATVREQRRGG